MSMTTLPEITASTTTSIPAPGREKYDVVPERLLRIDGVDYVRCDLHGLIPLDHECSKSPGDHWCRQFAHPTHKPGDPDDDQAVSHREWDRIQSEKLHLIASYHQKRVNENGMTDGCCEECDYLWPCRTVHIANGWGLGDECYDTGWCAHAGTRVER